MSAEALEILERARGFSFEGKVSMSVQHTKIIEGAIVSLSSDLEAARGAALEEAAKLSERAANDALHGGDAVGSGQPDQKLREIVSDRLSDFADEIRALKSNR